MSDLLSMNALRVDVEPAVGCAVRRVLDADACGALIARRVARLGARL